MSRNLIVGLLIALVAGIAGCGGGGGSNTPTTVASLTPPATSLYGTYILSSFELNYDNGTTLKSTDSTIKSYSGTWIIRPELTTYQNVTVNGIVGINTNATWNYNANTGQFQFITTGGVASSANVTISGNILTTSSHFATYGGFTEVDHWTKLSDSTTAKIAYKSIEDEIISPTEYQGGGLAGVITNSLEKQ